MEDNSLLMIILAFILGYMCSAMIKQMCGGRLVEGTNGPSVEEMIEGEQETDLHINPNFKDDYDIDLIALVDSYCPAGKYKTNNSCRDCPAGQYSYVGSSSCTVCPANTYSASGSGSCTDCPANTMSASGSGSCVDICPVDSQNYSDWTYENNCDCPVGGPVKLIKHSMEGVVRGNDGQYRPQQKWRCEPDPAERTCIFDHDAGGADGGSGDFDKECAPGHKSANDCQKMNDDRSRNNTVSIDGATSSIDGVFRLGGCIWVGEKSWAEDVTNDLRSCGGNRLPCFTYNGYKDPDGLGALWWGTPSKEETDEYYNKAKQYFKDYPYYNTNVSPTPASTTVPPTTVPPTTTPTPTTPASTTVPPTTVPPTTVPPTTPASTTTP